MNLQNAKILLTVYLGGRLAGPTAQKQGKKVLSKIKRSPYESAILDKKGIPTGKYYTPKGHYKAPNNFVPRETQECKQVTNLDESCVNYFISKESCPYRIKKVVWDKLTELQRLEYHLTITADGNKFSFDVVEA